MARLIEVDRKSAVLSRPSLPCISRYHAINLAAGCSYGCRYCYAQSFQHHPGHGKVLFYSNSLELLDRQLPRKRKKPEFVYFSTACEPFMPFKPVLDSLYSIMELLLDYKVSIRISTKSGIPLNFVKLFAEYPAQVSVRVGLTTINDSIRRTMEPNAASVNDRLDTLRNLIERGVKAGVRMDPLIPGLTDSDESLASLCRRISACGAQNAIASYLFLRRSIYDRMNVKFNGWKFSDMNRRFYTHKIGQYCGGGTIRTPPPEYRHRKYGRLKEIAADHGISIRLCNCKNPDVTGELCQPQKTLSFADPAQITLF